MITSYVDTPTFDGLKDEILLGLLAAYEIDKIIDASLRCVQLRGLRRSLQGKSWVRNSHDASCCQRMNILK